MSSPENNPNSQEKGPILLNTPEEMDSLIKRIIQTHPNATLEQLSLFGRQYYGNPEHSKQLTLYNQALARIKNRFVEADEKITPPTQTKQSPPTQTTSPQPTPPQTEKPAVPKTKPPIPNHRPALATLWPLSLIACTGLTVVLAISRADTNKPLFTNPESLTPTIAPTQTIPSYPCGIDSRSAIKFETSSPTLNITDLTDTYCGEIYITQENKTMPSSNDRLFIDSNSKQVAVIDPKQEPLRDSIGGMYVKPKRCYEIGASTPLGPCKNQILYLSNSN